MTTRFHYLGPFIACALAVSTPAVVAQAPAPDAAPAQAKQPKQPTQSTEAEFLRQCAASYEEILFSIFDEKHPTPTEQDIAARRVIGHMIAWRTRQWGKAPAAATALAEANQLLKSRYNDPVFMVAACHFMAHFDDHERVIFVLKDVPLRLPATPQGQLARGVAYDMLALAYEGANATFQANRDQAKVEASKASAAAALAAIRGGVFKDRPRFLVWMYGSSVHGPAWSAATAADFCDQIAAIDDVDKCTALTLRGVHETRLAWDARGKKYASKVTEQGWKGFAEHLGKAREALTAAYALHPERPEAAVSMITVAMGGEAAEDEDERTWFDRVRKAEIGNWDAHKSLRWALRPRWGGSIREMYDFGMECAASRRFDTTEPWSFILTLRDLVDETEDLEAIARAPQVLENARRILQAYLDAPEDAVAHYRARVDLITLLWAAGEYAEARRHVEILGHGPEAGDLSPWGIEASPLELFEEIWLFGSPFADSIRAADKRVEDEDWAGAALAYHRILNAAGVDDPTLAAAVQRRAEPARVRAVLMDGNVLEPRFLATFPAWQATSAAWTPVDAGRAAVQMKNDSTSASHLVLEPEIGRRYQASFTLEMPDTNYGKYIAGVYVGIGDDIEESRWHAVNITAGKKNVRSIHVACRNENRNGQSFKKDIEWKPSYDLTVKVWDGDVFVYLDSEFIFGGHVHSERPVEWGPRMALGGTGGLLTPTTTFSRIRIVKLVDPPAELDRAAVLRAEPAKPADKPQRVRTPRPTAPAKKTDPISKPEAAPEPEQKPKDEN